MCVCVCVFVSVRSFLPPRASRPRNIGMYVFTATRKTLLYIIIVIFAENVSFTSFACLRSYSTFVYFFVCISSLIVGVFVQTRIINFNINFTSYYFAP